MVLELAVKAACRFILTFNKHDFQGAEQFGLQAVNPGEFCKSLEHCHEYIEREASQIVHQGRGTWPNKRAFRSTNLLRPL